MHLRHPFVVAVLGTVVAMSACAKREQTEQRQQLSMSDTVVSGGDASQRTPPPKPAVDPSLSAVEIFSLIHERESQISQIITAGRLNEVRREAARIRELLKAAADRVTLPADQKVALDDHVAAADRAALALSEAGDAGDPVQSQAQNVELQKELGTVEKIVVGAGP